MGSKEFLSFYKKLNKTQKQMAQLLGTSIKAVTSYEQGWRTVPAKIERQIFFLVSRMRTKKESLLWRLWIMPPAKVKEFTGLAISIKAYAVKPNETI